MKKVIIFYFYIRPLLTKTRGNRQYLSVASLNAVGLHPNGLRFYNTLRDGKVLERLTKTSAVKNLTEEGTWAVGDCTREGAGCATHEPGVSYTKNVVEEQIRAEDSI